MVETLKTPNLVSDAKQSVGSDESVQFAALSAPGGFEVRAMNRQTVSEGIIYIELGPSYSEALPAWSPGAHIALESQGVPFRLHHHAPQKFSCTFFEQLSSASYADKLHLSYDEDAPTPVNSIFTPWDAGSFAYTCGPFGFMVKIKSTGQEVEVPAGTTVVQAFAAVGVNVSISCEQGICGSCLTPVLAGIPDHRDQFMLPEEQMRNDAFTPCCSRTLTA
jgi:ferredoxin